MMKIAALLAFPALGAVVTDSVWYKHGTEEVQGFLAVDDSFEGPRPAVLIAHDASGIDAVEERWAQRLAELGYVAFAGAVWTPEDYQLIEEGKRGDVFTKYRSNLPLWEGRLIASIDYLKEHPDVDATKIAAIGFCFGGSGVMHLARLNLPEVLGVGSFHGGLDTVETPTAISAKVLVVHGANDRNILNLEERGDNSGTMEALEEELDAANANWEVTKLSKTAHSFTNTEAGDDYASGSAYNAYTADRAFSSLTDFLQGVFDQGEADDDQESFDVVTEYVSYMHGEQELKGFLAYPAGKGSYPGVLVAHGWGGLSEEQEHAAKRLASEGYVAFANGVYTPQETQAATSIPAKMATVGKYVGDVDLWRARMGIASTWLQAHPRVADGGIGAIGFCFGGGSVLELARSNADGVQGVVSLHGSLGTQRPADEDFSAKVLILHGDKDANINNNQRGDNSGVMSALQAELEAADADWEITKYSNVVHGFTDPAAGDDPSTGNAYNPYASERAWSSLLNFFQQLFGRQVSCSSSAAPCLLSQGCQCKTGGRRLLFGGSGASPKAPASFCCT